MELFVLCIFVFVVAFLLFRINGLNKQIAAKELDLRFDEIRRDLTSITDNIHERISDVQDEFERQLENRKK